MKKIASLFLALVMALSLAVPAFATSGTVKVDGSIQMPTINVTLPTTASLVLNPYKMDVEIVKGTKVQDQVVSTLMQVKNLSDIDLKVAITAAGTKGKGTVAFAPASVASDTSAPKAFIYGVFKVGNATDTLSSSDTPQFVLAEAPAAPATAPEVTGFEATALATATNTLKAVDPADKKNPATNGVLNFQFFGDTSNVTTWTDKDTLGATVAFTFTPVANTAAAATYNITEGSHTGGSVTIEVGGSAATSAAAGDTVTLTAVPSGGGTTVTWTVTGASGAVSVTPDGSNALIGTFTMPAEAVSVTASIS